MSRPITIDEVPPFGRLAAACMTESELVELNYFIPTNPVADDQIRVPGERDD